MTGSTEGGRAEPSVFGAVRLGYLIIETEHFDDWRRFGEDAIGMHHDPLDRRHARFRLDESVCRFLLRRGPAEDVVTMGWHLEDDATFDAVERRVRDGGVPVTVGESEEAELRGVERFLRFPGPKDISQEISTGPRTADRPTGLRAASGFVTGGSGLGHVAITSTRPAEIHHYLSAVFDARLTDYIDETINGVKLRIRFLRVNERHHSVAVANTRPIALDPIRSRVQHLNVQVADLGDLAASYQRVHELGFSMALTVGQHTNDRELSYYAVTPSGFEWEVGWNPIVIDESTWVPDTKQGISLWGHTPVGQTLVDKLDQFRRGALSVLHPEPSVPRLAGADRN